MRLIQISNVEIERYKHHGMAHVILNSQSSGEEYQIPTRSFYANSFDPLSHVWINGDGSFSMKLILASAKAIPRKNALSIDINKKLEHIVVKIPKIQNFDLKTNITFYYGS